MTPRELEEYRALRDTIRERGTARAWLLLAGFVAWAALTIATTALAALPLATLLPLLILAVIFEAVFALHTGVERIGRYIQVFFEENGEGADRGWERCITAYGAAAPATAGDPLLAWHFCLATCANFIPVVSANPAPIEWGAVGVIHLLFMVRVGLAHRQASSQRAVDLERFREIRARSEGRHA
jgi:hypothetical protein